MSTNEKDKTTQSHEKPEKKFEIQIDRTHYRVTKDQMTGLEFRNLPEPPIGPDRDLFEVVPGGTDPKISNDQVVEMRNGLRFFTAPSQINPGTGSRGSGSVTSR